MSIEKDYASNGRGVKGRWDERWRDNICEDDDDNEGDNDVIIKGVSNGCNHDDDVGEN